MTINVVNMMGKTVRTLNNVNVINGQVEVDLGDVAAGTYMVNIITNDGLAVKRIVVAH